MGPPQGGWLKSRGRGDATCQESRGRGGIESRSFVVSYTHGEKYARDCQWGVGQDDQRWLCQSR
eukprot:755156-Hanusia_phi.AAC.4